MTGRPNTLRVIQSDDPDAPALAAEIAAAAWMAGASWLKKEGTSFVARATLTGRDVAIKLRTLDAPSRLKALVGHGRGDRQWEGASRLAAAGVPTARPLALLRGVFDGAHVEVFVTEFVAGPTLLECLGSDAWSASGSVAQHKLASAAGESIASLRAAELFNRDHKPSNLIVTHWPERPSITLLDTVAIRRNASDAAAARTLASLVIEPTGVGLVARLRRPLLFRAVLSASKGDRALARRLYRAAAAVVREHGDPTPRVNPLAPRSS